MYNISIIAPNHRARRFLAYIPSWRKKFAQAGKCGGRTPTPFHYIYHHNKIVAHAPAERSDTLLPQTLKLHSAVTQNSPIPKNASDTVQGAKSKEDIIFKLLVWDKK